VVVNAEKSIAVSGDFLSATLGCSVCGWNLKVPKSVVIWCTEGAEDFVWSVLRCFKPLVICSILSISIYF
jgi:hypothetical protein|tara:strand:+ start:5940 stop:6149 length:210 start_codon:yes stop_codon:yes gene_type:complete